MSRVFFISDTHFGHRNICRYRPEFTSVEQHDEFVFDGIMNTVTKRDTLWICGDVCFNMSTFNKYIIPICERVSVLRIVLGNHDNERLEAPKIQDYVNLGVDIFGVTKYKNCWVSHAPIHTEELRGKHNIHGHVHRASINDGRYINVSCEAVDYKPIDFQCIQKRINNVN